SRAHRPSRLPVARADGPANAPRTSRGGLRAVERDASEGRSGPAMDAHAGRRGQRQGPSGKEAPERRLVAQGTPVTWTAGGELQSLPVGGKSTFARCVKMSDWTPPLDVLLKVMLTLVALKTSLGGPRRAFPPFPTVK